MTGFVEIVDKSQSAVQARLVDVTLTITLEFTSTNVLMSLAKTVADKLNVGDRYDLVEVKP